MSNKKRYEKYGLREEAQDYLTNYMSISEPVSVAGLQRRVYGEGYQKWDSRQQGVIKEAIKHSRTAGIEKWITLCKSSTFWKEVDKIKENHPNSIEKELSSEDYAQFKTFMNNPVKSSGLITGLDEKTLAAISILWKQWIARLSRQKMNVVITTGGAGAKYYLPSFWKWNIRENKLIVRKWKTAIDGNLRANDAKVGLSSESQERLGMASDKVPSLEDKSDEPEEDF